MSDDTTKKILSYQESCDAGESVRSISGWFQKAKKAKRRVRFILLSLAATHVSYLSFGPFDMCYRVQVWPGQSKFERRYLTLAGYQLYYSRYAF